MARAKRTARADARRRYRASINAPDDDLDLDDADEAAAAGAASRPAADQPRASSTAQKPAAAVQRPGIAAAFRGAFTPVDVRGDLRALPRLLIDKSFLLPVGLILAVAVVIYLTGGQELISRTISPYFLAPPPIAPVFLAGFLAPRASWLIGGLIGVVQSVVVVLLVSSSALGPTTTGVTDSSLLAYSLTISVAFGAFYAAAAAWYKRFLRRANPQRQAPASASRSTSTQKRRGSESRPLLARRR